MKTSNGRNIVVGDRVEVNFDTAQLKVERIFDTPRGTQYLLTAGDNSYSIGVYEKDITKVL